MQASILVPQNVSMGSGGRGMSGAWDLKNALHNGAFTKLVFFLCSRLGFQF
jgi:hypothetical protein